MYSQYTSLDYVNISDLLLSVHQESENSFPKSVATTYGNISMEFPYQSSYLYALFFICFNFLLIVFSLYFTEWNSLPLHMRDPSVSPHVFKIRLKIYLEKRQKQFLSNKLVPGVIPASQLNLRLSFLKLFVKFEKTTYACISHLHLLYSKLSAVRLQ